MGSSESSSSPADADAPWVRIRDELDRAVVEAVQKPSDMAAIWHPVYDAVDLARASTDRRLELLRYLYVTSIRLLESRTRSAVIEVICEILDNLMGAASYLVLVWPPGSRYSRVAVRKGTPPPTPEMTEIIHGNELVQLKTDDGRHRMAISPIRHADRLVGAIVVGDLLPQKKGQFTDMDAELLRLLSGQAGPALSGAGQLQRAATEQKVVRELMNDGPGKFASLQGELVDSILVDVIQLIAMIRKSGRLVVSSENETAEFHFHCGDAAAVLAERARLELSRAPQLLCAWMNRSGSFKFYAEALKAPGKVMPCDALLLEAMRLHDELASAGAAGEWVLPAN